MMLLGQNNHWKSRKYLASDQHSLYPVDVMFMVDLLIFIGPVIPLSLQLAKHDLCLLSTQVFQTAGFV